MLQKHKILSFFDENLRFEYLIVFGCIYDNYFIEGFNKCSQDHICSPLQESEAQLSKTRASSTPLFYLRFPRDDKGAPRMLIVKK